jgi:hypothetical protein
MAGMSGWHKRAFEWVFFGGMKRLLFFAAQIDLRRRLY